LARTKPMDDPHVSRSPFFIYPRLKPLLCALFRFPFLAGETCLRRSGRSLSFPLPPIQVFCFFCLRDFFVVRLGYPGLPLLPCNLSFLIAWRFSCVPFLSILSYVYPPFRVLTPIQWPPSPESSVTASAVFSFLFFRGSFEIPFPFFFLLVFFLFRGFSPVTPPTPCDHLFSSDFYPIVLVSFCPDTTGCPPIPPTLPFPLSNSFPQTLVITSLRILFAPPTLDFPSPPSTGRSVQILFSFQYACNPLLSRAFFHVFA